MIAFISFGNIHWALLFKLVRKANIHIIHLSCKRQHNDFLLLCLGETSIKKYSFKGLPAAGYFVII